MNRRIIAVVLGIVLLASSLLAIPLAFADDEAPLPIVTDIPRVTPEPTEDEDGGDDEALGQKMLLPELDTIMEPEELTIIESDEDAPAAETPTPSPEITPEPTTESTPEPEQNYLCGLEVHLHDESCMDVQGSLICGLQEHVHSEACLTGSELVYYCGCAEHCHDESCLDENGNEICGCIAHVHTLACFTEPVPDPVYYCGLEQHIHDEACLDEGGNEICGIAEHLHDAACLIAPFSVQLRCSPETIYTGGMTALFSYTLINGTAPYTLLMQDSMNGELLYQQELIMPDADAAGFTYQGVTPGEHIIRLTVTDAEGDSAYAERMLTVRTPESEEQWEAALAAVPLTGDLRSDLIAIARSQVGYAESSENYILDAEGNARGFTRYGEWYVLPYEEWCAMFASYCLEAAGADLPLGVNCSEWAVVLSETGLYRAAAEYVPEAGDLVFFDRSGDALADHVGILEEIIFPQDSDGIQLTVIEGDSENQVARNEISLPDGTVLGYAQLGENQRQEFIEYMRKALAELPDMDAFDARLEELAGDVEQMEAYYLEMRNRILSLYVYYQPMSPGLLQYLPEISKLLEYSFIWESSVLAAGDPVRYVTVCSYNTKGVYALGDAHYPTMIRSQNQTLKSWCDANGGSNVHFSYYKWWDAVVVEEGENGLYVSAVYKSGVEKNSIRHTTANGFILFAHETDPDTQGSSIISNLVYGEPVVISSEFKYSTEKIAYSDGGQGLVYFGAQKKPAKNHGLKGFKGVDTSDLITIRMFDFDDSVNDKYTATINDAITYPGFQRPNGQLSSTAVKHSNFGDNVTADVGITNVTGNSPKGLNVLAMNADAPLTDAMHKSLVDGYPAMADGANGTSLKYLFDVAGKYRKGGDANYLFQKNEDSGQYWFNCRTNFAEYNAGNSEFTLYNETFTPNLTFYPFGNFLPFNHIETQTQRVSDINREYMLSILGSMEYKLSQGQNPNGQLAQTTAPLRSWIALMDETYGLDWNWANAMNAYLGDGNVPDFDAASNPNIKEESLYALDYDEPTDFFFGMSMEMDFVMPKDGWTGKDKNTDGIPDFETNFSFAGDDDVWVYIDDVLFLDLSGIHRHVGGEINFVTGTVNRYSFMKSNSSAQDPYDGPFTFRQILTAAGWSEDKIDAALEINANGYETFRDYSEHSLKFYYMERGSGSSICQMGFNMPVLRENAISVGKELDIPGEAKPLGSPDFKFQVLKPDGSLMIDQGREYRIYQGDPALNHEIGTGIVGANGIFSLKAGQYAQFTGITEDQGQYIVRELMEDSVFQQYGIISVTGTSTTTANGTDVQIGETSFKGYDSPVMDISTGSTTFRFTNQADPGKFGSLRISKIVDAPEALSGDWFDFNVSIDGDLLPVGMSYTVQDANGTKLRDAAVESKGIISLKHGETAVIGPILAGSRYTVTELNSTATSLAELATKTFEYDVTYSVDGGEATTAPAAGIIRDGSQSTVSVAVLNKMTDSASVTIPVTKKLPNPDGLAHTYSFVLQQIANGSPVGSPKTVTLTLPAGENKLTLWDAFEIWYRPGETGTYVYQISESLVQEEGTTFDSALYQVTVSVGKDALGKMTAGITCITRDSEDITSNSTSEGESKIAFTNVLADSLSISKIVDGTAGDQDKEFTFTLELRDADKNPLSGSFDGVKITSGGENLPITEAVIITLSADGAAQFTLKHGQTLSIEGLPKGTIWKVTETPSDDYKTIVTAGGDPQETNAALGTIQDSGASVTFTNTRLYVLPSTGGAGVHTLYMLGAAFMLLAGFALLTINKTKTGHKRCSGK